MSVEIEWGRWTPAQAPVKDPSIGDFYNATKEDGRRNANVNSRQRYLEDEYDLVNDNIHKATGQRLLNPYRLSLEEAQPLAKKHGFTQDIGRFAELEWRRRFDEMAKASPDKADWATLREQAVNRYREKRRAAEEANMQAIDSAGMVTGRDIPYLGKVPVVREAAAAAYNAIAHPQYTAAQFAGSLIAQSESPIDLLVMVGTGISGSAAKSLVWNAARAGGVNAAGQAFLEPMVQANRADAGQEHGLGMALDNIAGAAALGFVLDLGVRGPARAGAKKYGRDTPAGTFGSKHGRGGFALDAKTEISSPRPIVRDQPSEATLKKAEAGDVEALKEVATKTGAIEDPAVKGALDYLELGGRIDEEAMARLQEMEIANPEGMDFMARVLRGEYSREPTPIPKAKAPRIDDPEITAKFDKLEAKLTDIDQRTKQITRKAADIGIPEIVEAVKKGPKAVTQAIEDLGGPQVLADKVTVMSSTDLVATATALRRSPQSMDSNVSIQTGFMQTARSLAALDEGAFARVRAGDVNPNYAALVADRVKPGKHAQVLDVIKDASDMNEARAGIQEIADLPPPVPKEPVSMLDDPSGPDAKKQIERLEATMKEKVERATAPIKRRDELESKAETLRGEIAKLERGEGKTSSNDKTSQAPEADTYKDPTTGETLQGAEVDSIIDMWRFVNETKNQKKPQQLSSFLVESGRIKDEHGELSNILGGQARYLISENGLSLDDAALRSWEKGFFTGSDRPTIAEFIDALDSDVRGEKKFSALDHDRVEDASVAREMANDLDELGVLNAKSESEIQQYFSAGEGPKRSGSSETSPKGTKDGETIAALGSDLAAKRAELHQIESDLAAANAKIMGAAGAEAYRIVMDRLNIQRMMDVTKTIDDAIAFAKGIVPEGTKIDVLSEEQSIIKNNNGVTHQVDATSNAKTGDIGIAMHALDPASRLGHEALHTLVTRGLMSPDEVSLLAKAARELKVFKDEASYKKVYEGRENAARLIDEEAAASLIEAKIKGKKINAEAQGVLDRIKEFFRQLAVQLGAMKLRTADEVATAMLSGEMAQRRAQARWMRGGVGDTMAALSDGRSQLRSLDQLGYYSQALEAAKALKQAKGTPEQMLAQLKKAGVKDAEIEATGLKEFLDGKKSVTRDEIVGHLEANRVQLNEVVRGYDPENENAVIKARKTLDDLKRKNQSLYDDHMRNRPAGQSKYSWDQEFTWPSEVQNASERYMRLRNQFEDVEYNSYSLDPENPTYRETVLHLQAERRMSFEEYEKSYRSRFPDASATSDEIRTWYTDGTELPGSDKLSSDKVDVFQSGHFPEPNITGHLMTSMVKDAKGRSVFNVDQIQSDWGQRLRDGGVRDEKKVAELREATKTANEKYKSTIDRGRELASKYGASEIGGSVESALMTARDVTKTDSQLSIVDDAIKQIDDSVSKRDLLNAELKTAEAAVSGNPLVNTTDQWVNTTLRHALRQAIAADADAISIPSGETVLSYNPGDTHGMNEFYNKIVPKNLRKILQKFDKSIKPERTETMDSPSGAIDLGKGFTVFPLTDKVKQRVADEGQPLFALAGKVAAGNIDSASSSAARKMGLLGTAKKMAAKGRTNEQLAKQTGWFKKKNGVWAFEIDDSNAKMKNLSKVLKPWPVGGREAKKLTLIDKLKGVKEGQPEIKPRQKRYGIGDDVTRAFVKLKDVFDHPVLFEAYPILKDMSVVIVSGKDLPDDWNMTGSFITRKSGGKKQLGIVTRGRTEADIKGALLHELQHLAQSFEKWDDGSNPNYFDPGKIQGGLTSGEWSVMQVEKFWEKYSEKEGKDKWSHMSQMVADRLRVGFLDYSKSPGEVEAELMRTRADLTAAQRANDPIWKHLSEPGRSGKIYRSLNDALTEGHRRLSSTRRAKWRRGKPVEIAKNLTARRLVGADRLDDIILIDYRNDSGDYKFTIELSERYGFGDAQYNGMSFHVPDGEAHLELGSNGFMDMGDAERRRVVATINDRLKASNQRLVVDTAGMELHEAKFWWSINERHGRDDARLYYPEIERLIKEKYGRRTVVEMGNGHVEDWEIKQPKLTLNREKFDPDNIYEDIQNAFYKAQKSSGVIIEDKNGVAIDVDRVVDPAIVDAIAMKNKGDASARPEQTRASSLADKYISKDGKDLYALSEPDLAAELAGVDRMSVLKDMVAACRG